MHFILKLGVAGIVASATPALAAAATQQEGAMTGDSAIRLFRVSFPQADLDDLRQRFLSTPRSFGLGVSSFWRFYFGTARRIAPIY
jgi:hypothetical protein